MKTLLKRLRYLLTAPAELDGLIEELKKKKQAAEIEANRHCLNLCFKHRQERNRSHYCEANCHYCQLQNYSESLHTELISTRRLLADATHKKD